MREAVAPCAQHEFAVLDVVWKRRTVGGARRDPQAQLDRGLRFQTDPGRDPRRCDGPVRVSDHFKRRAISKPGVPIDQRDSGRAGRGLDVGVLFAFATLGFLDIGEIRID